MLNLSAIVLAVLFCIVGIWLIVEGETTGWLALLFFGSTAIALIIPILGRREATLERADEGERKQVQKEREAEVEEVRKLVAENDVDVPEDPVDVWKSILVEEGADWVVFENGTLVICEEGKPAEQSALDIIGEFIRTSVGDYSVIIRPEFGIWIITYPGNRVVNYMELKGCASDTAAGLMARTISRDDANEKNIVHVHVVDKPEVGDSD